MADDDRLLGQIADEPFIPVGDLAERKRAEARGRPLVHLRRCVIRHERPRRRIREVPPGLEEFAERIPARWRDPGSVDEHDGVGHANLLQFGIGQTRPHAGSQACFTKLAIISAAISGY